MIQNATAHPKVVAKDVFHTYSTYARGVESLTDSYSLLDRDC
ncbi:DUF899 family protein [Leptothermofonsia sichuanensis]